MHKLCGVAHTRKVEFCMEGIVRNYEYEYSTDTRIILAHNSNRKPYCSYCWCTHTCFGYRSVLRSVVRSALLPAALIKWRSLLLH